jgi:hypothetical protein
MGKKFQCIPSMSRNAPKIGPQKIWLGLQLHYVHKGFLHLEHTLRPVGPIPREARNNPAKKRRILGGRAGYCGVTLPARLANFVSGPYLNEVAPRERLSSAHQLSIAAPGR